jgi:hypothetical protein
MSRARLWRIMTGREDSDVENVMMTWGVENEWQGVAATSQYLGVIFDHTGDFQRNHGPHVMTTESCVYEITCHPDGQYGDRIGLEVKCPCSMTMDHKLYDSIQPHHMSQMQTNMLVCGFDMMYYACWTPDEVRVWRVESSAAYVDWMQDRLSEFGHFLVKDEAPTKLGKRPVPPDVAFELAEQLERVTKSYGWETELRDACSVATKQEHLDLLRKSFPARLGTPAEIDRMSEIMEERAALLR